MFGRLIKSACPLAETSKVYVDISGNKVCQLVSDSSNELSLFY